MRTLLIILAFVISSTANARPTFGSVGCENSGCHDNPSVVGTVSVPTSIDVDIDSLANTATFLLSGTWGGNATIALIGTDAAGLDATIGPGWTDSGAGFIYFTNLFDTATTSVDLTFDVGALADPALGPYTIGVKFVGGSGGGIAKWADLTSFDVNVVPIPAAVWLFGSGLLGLVGVARMRRNKT